MNRLELLEKSIALLGRFSYEAKISNAIGLFDINTIAEDFLTPIFSIIFKCPDLCNQNRIQMNFPAVDLGCRASRISIQITSDPSANKVRNTLEKFKSHNLSSDFDHLYIYVITDKQKSYNSQKLMEEIDSLAITFNSSKDILDYRDIAKMLNDLSNAELKRINDHLEHEFMKIDEYLQFREDLDKFINISQQKIEDEKKSKKYISSIFVETSETKEDIRYFANPIFFYRKIDDDIKRINLDCLNLHLQRAKIAPIENKLCEIDNLKAPTNLSELQEYLRQKNTILDGVKEDILPFSWCGVRDKRFQPDKCYTGYWEVFRFSIQCAAFKVFEHLEKICEKIRIANAKIFLVTGMAGQGKTNFVCDLIENQFKVFEIPSIYIPARFLNNYQPPDRILSYIKNNRFAPNVANIHTLLSLLNSVAMECGKPFIIVIDGINEIGDLNAFITELKTFIDALCQYDFIKTVITCRNEFFDHKFLDVFEPQFSDYIYRVKDLRTKMSDTNKSQLLNVYLDHFQINANLSKNAKKFLKNDLILLRIFSEIHEGRNIGYISDIYKGDIFEEYLIKKIKEFPSTLKQKVLVSLYKICFQMFTNDEFSQVSLEHFENDELQIIEKLIEEDIILRRELPSTGLATLGIENISFTYDELRDFLLAYYIVVELVNSDLQQVQSIFTKISKWPIYEGFFRYVYILARKHQKVEIVGICEAFPDFREHYINNLSVLSPDIQTDKDIDLVKNILVGNKDYDIYQVAWFLIRKIDNSGLLNIQILLNHISNLNNKDSESFFQILFPDSPKRSWRDQVTGMLSRVNSRTEDSKLSIVEPILIFILYILPFADRPVREETLNFFTKFKNKQSVRNAIDSARTTASIKVKTYLDEILEEQV